MRRGRAIPLLIAGLAALLLLQVTSAQELYERLQPTGYVNDYARVMNSTDKETLELLLAELERKTTSQVSVVTVSSLEGGEIQDFANRLFERWGIGQKRKDNGVLIVAAIGDRKIWIEVGYELEGLLPDARNGRILDEDVMPYFRQGEYSTGLVSGASRIAALVAKEAGVDLSQGEPPRASPRPDTGQERGIGCFGIIVIVILLIVFIRHPFLFLLLLGGLGGGGGRGGFGGGGFGGGGFGGFGGGSSGGGGAGRSW